MLSLKMCLYLLMRIQMKKTMTFMKFMKVKDGECRRTNTLEPNSVFKTSMENNITNRQIMYNENGLTRVHLNQAL